MLTFLETSIRAQYSENPDLIQLQQIPEQNNLLMGPMSPFSLVVFKVLLHRNNYTKIKYEFELNSVLYLMKCNVIIKLIYH